MDCPPKAQVLKALSLEVKFRHVMETFGGGHNGKTLCCWTITLKEILRIWPSFLFSLRFWGAIMKWAACTCTSLHDVLHCHRPKSNASKWLHWHFQKCEPKEIFLLLPLLHQVCCYSNLGKLIVTFSSFFLSLSFSFCVYVCIHVLFRLKVFSKFLKNFSHKVCSHFSIYNFISAYFKIVIVDIMLLYS